MRSVCNFFVLVTLVAIVPAAFVGCGPATKTAAPGSNVASEPEELEDEVEDSGEETGASRSGDE